MVSTADDNEEGDNGLDEDNEHEHEEEDDEEEEEEEEQGSPPAQPTTAARTGTSSSQVAANARASRPCLPCLFRQIHCVARSSFTGCAYEQE